MKHIILIKTILDGIIVKKSERVARLGKRKKGFADGTLGTSKATVMSMLMKIEKKMPIYLPLFTPKVRF